MGAPRFNMCETRPPDERTIAKDPKIAHIGSPVESLTVAQRPGGDTRRRILRQ
jgi:hypothetical protein